MAVDNCSVQCQHAEAHRLVIFNRVPKCGSTSLEVIIRRQASDKRFAFVRSMDFVNNSLDCGELEHFAQTISSMTERYERVLYDRHVIYVDFFRYGLPRPAYINLLRDPLRMQVSAFYFWRQCVCVTRQPFCASIVAPLSVSLCRPEYTIDTLYANVSARPGVGLITRWFCGHGRTCGGGPLPPLARVREKALRRATVNLRERYIWVGILERLEDSLRLLATVLPAYFGRMAVWRAAMEHARPKSNASEYKYSAPSEATVAKLRVENINDLHLYAHAVDVLGCRLRSCGLDKRLAPLPPHPQPPSSDGFGGARAFHATPNAAVKHLLRRRHRVGVRPSPAPVTGGGSSPQVTKTLT